MKSVEFLRVLLFTIFIIALISSCSLALYPIDCFEYYKFQDGVIFDSLNPEKVSYQPGDNVIFSYNLISKMEAPITEGRVRVQIFYNDEIEGETIIDEFFLNEKISMHLGDVLEKEFLWKIPPNAKSGEYIAKTYFIVGKFFNLAGLSFLAYGPPGAPGALTTFNVNNTYEASRIYFSKKNTYINGKKYDFGAFFPEFEREDRIKIETELVNEGRRKEVQLEIKIYEWDDVTEYPLGEYSKMENIVLESNERKKISFELPPLKPGSYQVRFIAKSGEEKSILKVRFSIRGEMGRFIYLGLLNFPVKIGENLVFVCLSNSADYSSSFEGKIKIYGYDKEGNLIFSDETVEEIISKPMGFATTFNAKKEYKYLTLIGEIYGSDGKLHDKEIITYDYSEFPFVPRLLSVETDKNEYLVGEEIKYKINYDDGEGYPISGIVTIELSDIDGKVLFAYKTRVDGTYEKTTKAISPGSYRILAFDAERNIKSEKIIRVFEEKETERIKVEPINTQNILIAIMVIILLLLVYKFVLRR